MATGRLVSLLGRVLATGSYAGAGIGSPEQWVAWKCGVSLARARAVVSMARRLPELAETRTALEAGELAEDQVAVICRHTPAHNDAEAAELARSATVSQLRRALSGNSFAQPAADAKADAEPVERRRVGFGYGDDGWWHLSAVLLSDEGALVERALSVHRHNAMTGDGPNAVSWADALVAVGAHHWRPRPSPAGTVTVTWWSSTSAPTTKAGPTAMCIWARPCPTACGASAPATPGPTCNTTPTPRPSASVARPASCPTAPAWP
ncbi:MAG: DUF222 domain-containing protein [Actinomycetota bacterium]|nr:DUF222 domain-containing protein [Actinomycetota bacterium]